MSIQEFETDEFRIEPVIHHNQLTQAPAVLAEHPLKRSLDVVFALVGLLITAPLWIVAAAAIALETHGGVLYRQTRWGRGGRFFDVLKFRTMHADSDEIYGVLQATSDDPRVTSVGRLLRKTGIDELPQLVNILRGEMSLVGPRPLAVGETIDHADGLRIAYEDSPLFLDRLGVKPGLTSTATIYLPRDASAEEKFAVDIAYIQHRALIRDLKLIVLSVWVSIRGRWEVRTDKV